MKTIVPQVTIAMALLLTMCGIVMAAPVNQSITYQGTLMNSAGNPLTGTYTVIFSLYEVSSGGSALAMDKHAVQSSDGLFTTQIAFNQNLYDGQGLWLGISIGADPEMTPRQEIRPVPYALSLRPGAIIRGSGTTPILTVSRDGDSGNGINVTTSGRTSHGVNALTSGYYSNGVYALTSGYSSHGVYASTTNSNSYGLYAKTTGSTSNGVYATTAGTDSPGVRVSTSNSGSAGVYAMTSGLRSDGVYAQATGPYAYGILTSSSQSSGVWADTGKSDHKYGVQTPDIIRALGYETGSSDVAEFMPVTGDVSSGTVLIIGSDGKLQPSTTSYDTRVAGIVSTAPGVSLGAKEEGNPGDALIAVAGRVPCKVDANFGAIHPGDVLSTSDNPGFAMKAEPVNIGDIKIYKPSTILGKAMGTLESGTGTIEVLVTLQ